MTKKRLGTTGLAHPFVSSYSVNIYKQRLRYHGHKDAQRFQLITGKHVTIIVVTTRCRCPLQSTQCVGYLFLNDVF